MAKAPAVQFYVSDFLTGTTLMTNEEVGLYIRLLCLQAENGSVPDDPGRMSMVYGPSVQKAWPAVRSKFIQGEHPGTMVNEKMARVLADRAEFRRKQSEKGKASAEARLTSVSKKKQPRSNRGSTVVEPLEGEDRGIDRVRGDGGGITQGRKERATEGPQVLPFASEAFANAWYLWEASRKEQGKPIKPTTRKLQLAKCVELGEDRAIAALKHSATNGWAGLYEPNNTPRNGAQRTIADDIAEGHRIIAERYGMDPKGGG